MSNFHKLIPRNWPCQGDPTTLQELQAYTRDSNGVSLTGYHVWCKYTICTSVHAIQSIKMKII